MSFSQASITGVRMDRRGRDLCLAWTSSAATGTTFHVYVGNRLAWSGLAKSCVIPAPTTRSRIVIGTVGAGEAELDMSTDAGYPSTVADRAVLTWSGGAYLSEELTGFAIYAGANAGDAVSYTTPVALVDAVNGATATDGFGVGTFGAGGFGRAAQDYSWTSAPLGPGTWNFGVKARRAGGVESTAVTASVTISAPPRPPASFSDGTRLQVASYNSGTRVATVSFNDSPASGSPTGPDGGVGPS